MDLLAKSGLVGWSYSKRVGWTYSQRVGWSYSKRVDRLVGGLATRELAHLWGSMHIGSAIFTPENTKKQKLEKYRDRTEIEKVLSNDSLRAPAPRAPPSPLPTLDTSIALPFDPTRHEMKKANANNANNDVDSVAVAARPGAFRAPRRRHTEST